MSDNTAPPAPPSPRRCPRWIGALLVASLAVNLLVAGLAGGAFLKGMEHDGRRGMEARILEALPEERRAEAREILSPPSDAQSREIVAAIRSSIGQTLAALRAEEFDAAALSASAEARRAAVARRFELRNERFVKLAGMLSPEERRALADAVEERSRHWIRKMENRLDARGDK